MSKHEKMSPHKSCQIGPNRAEERREEAFCVREKAAEAWRRLPLPDQPCNHDEQTFPHKIGNFSKGLPHNSLGEVEPGAYHSFIEALKTGDPQDFESIPLGGATRLSNPQSAYTYDLAGPDSHHMTINAPPSIHSAWDASEIAEVYWQALTRDISFNAYNTHPLTLSAAADLSKFSDFRGPKVDDIVTTATLFRGMTPGDLIGPYLSQFLWKDIPFGATTIAQRYQTTVAGDDHLKSYDEWLKIQNGFPPTAKNHFDPTPRYIRNNRDLAAYVHKDFNYQSILSACLILLGFGNAALDPANPYLHSKTQIAFNTFGAPHILDFVAKAARAALLAGWFQKFLVHRRLRPEAFGGCVHNHLTKADSYPIHPELLQSQAISMTFKKFGTYLLPQAYPEGCPTHPSYPAGHACTAGARVTMLKAFFNESFILPDPVVSSSTGRTLLPYSGPPLTIGGELNKLASNIALGRDAAGVHWRSDGTEGLKLGEAIAIGILEDYRNTYNEHFHGFTLTKFDGTTIKVR